MTDDEAKRLGLLCPRCGCPDTAVYKTRKHHRKVIKYRICDHCEKRFASIEVVATTSPATQSLDGYEKK